MAVNNFGAGTYVITWDQPVTATPTATPDPNLLALSQGAAAWQPLTVIAQFAPTAAEYTSTALAADCTRCVMLRQPLDITSPDNFEIATPVINVIPPPPTPTTITAVHSAGSGDYTVTFSNPINQLSSGLPEPRLLIHSPSAPGWLTPNMQFKAAPNLAVFHLPGNPTDGTKVILLGQLTTLSTNPSFSVATPITPVT